MKRLATLIGSLLLLSGCLPGLGTITAVPVRVETPSLASAAFTPEVPVQDLIVNFAGGGITKVWATDDGFQCQEFRSGWDCFVTGQDDSSVERVVHPAGETIRFWIQAERARDVVGSAAWKPAN